jgi:hypothetical protein
MLVMTRSAGPLAALEVVATQKVEQIRHAQLGYFIRLSLFINQQREIDSRFFLKNVRVIPISQTDCCQRCSSVFEGLLVFAQLRDVLAAKDSSIVPQKNNHGGFAFPQRTQPNFLPECVRQYNLHKPPAESFLHAAHHSRFFPALSISRFRACAVRLWHSHSCLCTGLCCGRSSDRLFPSVAAAL